MKKGSQLRFYSYSSGTRFTWQKCSSCAIRGGDNDKLDGTSESICILYDFRENSLSPFKRAHKQTRLHPLSLLNTTKVVKKAKRSGKKIVDFIPLSTEPVLLQAPCSAGWLLYFLIECRTKNKSFSFHCKDGPKLWPYSHLYYLYRLHSPSHLSALSHCHWCLLNTPRSISGCLFFIPFFMYFCLVNREKTTDHFVFPEYSCATREKV